MILSEREKALKCLATPIHVTHDGISYCWINGVPYDEAHEDIEGNICPYRGFRK